MYTNIGHLETLKLGADDLMLTSIQSYSFESSFSIIFSSVLSSGLNLSVVLPDFILWCISTIFTSNS